MHSYLRKFNPCQGYVSRSRNAMAVSFWQVMLICLISVPLPSAAEEPVDREIDRRNATDTTADKYFVIFCARQSKDDKQGVGHAFVVWAEESETKKLSASRAFGFYPAEDAGKKAVFGAVHGRLADDGIAAKLALPLTHRLKVRVARDQWRESQKEIDVWKTTDYNLYENNCTHFAQAVAMSLNIIVERPKSELPSSFLLRLIDKAGENSK